MLTFAFLGHVATACALSLWRRQGSGCLNPVSQPENVVFPICPGYFGRLIWLTAATLVPY